MKRLIAYIYGYRNGIKGKNEGFGKIDTKGNDMKINISLRYNGEPECLKVYFFLCKEGKTYAIYLGDMEYGISEYELKRIVNIKELTNGMYGAGDIHGILVKRQEQIRYVSFWKEEYIIDEIVDMNGEDEKEEIGDSTDSTVHKDITDSSKTGKDESLSKDKNPSVDDSIRENKSQREDKNTEEDNIISEDNNTRDTLVAREERDNLSINEHREIEVEEEDTVYLIEPDCTPVNDAYVAKQIELRATSISQYMKNKQIREITIDNESHNMCEIVPRDIYEFPRECWCVGKNAYACHGFIKYGRLYVIEWDGLYLGVPGYNSTNEKILADRYGFETFIPNETECLKASSCNKWHRGYWCKKML